MPQTHKSLLYHEFYCTIHLKSKRYNHEQITETLKTLSIHPDEIADARLAEVIRILLQLIEELCWENDNLKAELPQLRDAINLIKGEQTKPKIKPSGKRQNEDSSSEKERKNHNISRKKKSKAKKHKINIDRTEV